MQKNDQIDAKKESEIASDESKALSILNNFTIRSMTTRERTKLIAQIIKLHALNQKIIAQNEESEGAFEELVDTSYLLLGRFVEEDQSKIDELDFEDLSVCFSYLIDQMNKKKA